MIFLNPSVFFPFSMIGIFHESIESMMLLIENTLIIVTLVMKLEFLTHGHAFLARISMSPAICRPLCLCPHSSAGCSAHTVKGITPPVQGYQLNVY